MTIYDKLISNMVYESRDGTTRSKGMLMTHRGVWYAQAKLGTLEANLDTFTLRSVFHYIGHAPF
jgi:hypothetical protein